ncbi:hypothetical protein ACFVZ1_23700 [Bacillus subtilis]
MEDDTSDGLIRIDITASSMDAVKLVVEQLSSLWLVSASSPRPWPGEGIRVTVHADVHRLPHEGGYLFPTCPHISDE